MTPPCWHNWVVTSADETTCTRCGEVINYPNILSPILRPQAPMIASHPHAFNLKGFCVYCGMADQSGQLYANGGTLQNPQPQLQPGVSGHYGQQPQVQCNHVFGSTDICLQCGVKNQNQAIRGLAAWVPGHIPSGGNVTHLAHDEMVDAIKALYADHEDFKPVPIEFSSDCRCRDLLNGHYPECNWRKT